MATNPKDIISSLIVELEEALAPVSHLRTEQSVRFLLQQLGYDVPTGLNFDVDISTFIELPPRVTFLIDAIERESSDDIRDALIEIIPKLAHCVDQLITLSNSIRTGLETIPSFVEKSGIASNLPTRILDFLIVTHFQYKYKKVHSLLLALGIFKREKQQANPEKFLLAAGILTVQWDHIGKLLSNPEKLIKDTFQWSGAQEFIMEFVELGYGELLEIIADFFRSISMPAGIFPHHGDVNLDSRKARNRELRIPLLQAGSWPTAYSEFGMIMRLYTGVVYAPIEIPSIDEGSDPLPSDDDDSVNEDNDFPTDTPTGDQDSVPDEGNDGGSSDPDNDGGETLPEDLSYLESDRSPLEEKPSIPDPKGLELQAYFVGNIDVQKEIAFDLGADWNFRLGFGAGASISEGINLILEPQKGFSISVLGNDQNPVRAKGEIALTLSQGDGQEPKFLFGRKNETSLSYLNVGIKSKMIVSLPSSYSFDIKTFIKGGKFILSANGMDNFLAKILPENGIITDFDITIGWSMEKGVYFEGSGGLEILLPAHIELGPLKIEGLTIALKVKDGGIPLEVSSTLRAELGPLQAVVENVGLSCIFSFPANNKGKLGPVDFNLGFKPPNGIGFSLDASVIKGGGYLYLNYEKGEYAGALELTISDYISLKAIGLINTKMPDGSKGFSLLIIITAEFASGIQLGYGFSLIGVGGLLGLNRTMKLLPLMEGVRTGAVNNIMFPQDIVKNAPRIISDLRTIFPPYEGKFLIGPMIKLAWGGGGLITISLGVIIEIPGNIAILGVLRVAIARDDAVLLILQVSFAGAIEFDKKRLYFFASLFESRILEFPLDGDMGLLVAWGEDANFVHSVGGFHPSFRPPPLPFPSPNRLSLSILDSADARIQVMAYFAVTSNTVQFGAKAELLFDFDVIRVLGFLAFDALIQFSPFYFIVEISAAVELKIAGTGLFSIRLHFSLEGPSPWRAQGTGSISLLFFSVDVNFDKTWGEAQDTVLPPIEVIPLLVLELNKSMNWVAEIPVSNNLLVSLRPPETAIVREAILKKVAEAERSTIDEALSRFEQETDENKITAIRQSILDKIAEADKVAVGALLDNLKSSAIVLHPLGTLRISQRAIPLDLAIDKVGGQKSSDAKLFSISVSGDGLKKTNDSLEQFAIAQYQDMSDASKLTRPAFERVHGGVNLSATGQQLRASKVVKRVIRYEQVLIDKGSNRIVELFIRFAGTLFDHFLRGASISKSDLSQTNKSQKIPFVDKITTQEEYYAVVFQSTNKAINEGVSFASQAMAQEFMRQVVQDDPSQADALQVIPEYEVVP